MTLTDSLRALSAHKHDDLAIGADAADCIDELQAHRDRAVRLLHLAMRQLRRWSEAYGQHTPPWLPPGGDVRLAEDVDEFLAAPALPLPDPPEVAPTSTRSGTAGSTDKGCDPADERAAFEAWYGFDGQHPMDMERDEDGWYHSDFVRFSWEAWQARAAIGQPAPTGGTKEQG